MSSGSGGQEGFAKRIGALLPALGIGLLISSVAVDYLPNARPGFNSFQALLLMVGLMLVAGALLLQKARAGGAMSQRIRKNLPAGIAVTVITLVALEFALALMGLPSHYPAEIPAIEYERAPWWTCDASGCHYVAAHIHEVCDSAPNTPWPCIVNQQGYYDRQDFVAGDHLDSRLRILMLGDSFTFGLSAAAGKSYVDVIEAQTPNSVVWNTGISGIGTKQALASFQAFAPIMRPQIAIYGFYVNDFDDNLLPIDGYFVGVGDDGRPIGIRNHRVDKWGNLTKLEQSSAIFYHEHGVDPPSSEIERVLGLTRLGSLLLNAVETFGNASGLSLRVRHEKRLAATRESLLALHDAAAALDTTLLVILIPSKDDLREGAGLRHRAAIALFDELSIAYMNPIDALEVKADYAPADDAHWNTAGHQKIGKMLSDCLKLFRLDRDLGSCDRVVAP